MNRAELVEELCKVNGESKSQNDRFLSAFIDLVKTHISDSNGVKLVGFGTFKVADRKERVARNPQTGATLTIPARKVPVFKPGLELKEVVNK